LTASYNILLKNSEYSINFIIDILKEENKEEFENKFNKYLDSIDYLDYEKIISLQNKIIDFLIFLQHNYKVGIDNIPIYNKTKVPEKSLINSLSKSNKRKLNKSKSESIIKCKRNHLMDIHYKLNCSKNENIEIRKEKEYSKSEIISIEGIEHLCNKEKKSKSLKDFDTDNETKKKEDHNITDVQQQNKDINKNILNIINIDTNSIKDSKVINDIKENIKSFNDTNENDNKFYIPDDDNTSVVKTDKISIINEKSTITSDDKVIDNENENNDKCKISNTSFKNKENDNNDMQNSNVILKKDNNNEYILLNIDGNEIECISSNESFINDNKNILNNQINKAVEEKNIDSIHQVNISNKYLKSKSSETLPENSININNSEVSIKITTLPINHKQLESLSEECDYDNLSTEIIPYSENHVNENNPSGNIL